jgi:adenylate kinase family enzyme
MKKIFIIGIVASGKTTLAKKLSNNYKIPWYELDNIVHNKIENSRRKRTNDELFDYIKEINEKGEWIFEGVYRESYHYLLDMAEEILFLDPPLWKRKVRILLRHVKQNLGIEKCEYKPDLKMLKMMYKWTDDFEKNRENFEAILSAYKEKVIKLN